MDLTELQSKSLFTASTRYSRLIKKNVIYIYINTIIYVAQTAVLLFFEKSHLIIMLFPK